LIPGICGFMLAASFGEGASTMTFRLQMLGLCLVAVAFPASAQDAQTLVAKNLEARGGAAALDAIKTLSFEGRTIAPGDFELSYKAVQQRTGDGAAIRYDFGVQGLDIVQAYDGHEGWRINPFQGRKDAERMSADDARQLADAALIEGPLLASRHDGSRVEYLGRDDFDGTLAYKLKVTQKDGDEFTYWLDPDTFLEIKVEETTRIRGAQQTSDTELGDYEKVAGVYFPMSIESWNEGQSDQRQRTVIATGTANAPVSASLFAEPGGAPAPAKASGEPPDASNTLPKKAKSGRPAGKPSRPVKGK
jgi:hypothetical protein